MNLKKWILQKKYELANYKFLVYLSFYPLTTIVYCLLVTLMIDMILSCCMFYVETDSIVYDVLFALITGVTTSCIVAIVVELSNNYKNNRLACYELESYYNFVIDFEGKKCVANVLMNTDEEYEVHDIVQLVWNELPKMAPMLLKTLEHKKAFLSNSEIRILKCLKFEYDSISDIVCSKISSILQYNTVNHPDEEWLTNKYPNNILEDLPEWLKKHLSAREGEAAIQKLTDAIMSDEILLKQFMSDYDISIQSMNRHNNVCEQDDIKVMQEEIEASEELTDDYTDMTEEEYKIWCDDIYKDIEKKEIFFVSFYISQSCFKIAQHIWELKKFVSQKPYVGVYLEIIASTYKKA